MKFRSVGIEIHAGGQIDGDNKTNSAFPIFSNAPKNVLRSARVRVRFL
jgi:hypothetical protein